MTKMLFNAPVKSYSLFVVKAHGVDLKVNLPALRVLRRRCRAKCLSYKVYTGCA